MFSLRLLTAAAVLGSAPGTTAQSEALYSCTDTRTARPVEIGVTICDASPTEALAARFEDENLQRRSGALITDVSAGSLAQIAGLAPGDVIYRVGGVDVEDEVEASARLDQIGEDSDTVVNFLRRGRPYRVKLRQR